jgi:hypothetical protein
MRALPPCIGRLVLNIDIGDGGAGLATAHPPKRGGRGSSGRVGVGCMAGGSERGERGGGWEEAACGGGSSRLR